MSPMNDRPRPRKRFGQHFLHDRHIIDDIINAIDPSPGETIVEIGPGRGALTLPLLARAGELHVVEIDRDLTQYLTELCATRGTLHVHCVDALAFNFHHIGKKHLKLAGNLPYNISTPLLFHLLDQIDCIDEMIFMLQAEVVDRLTATPGCKTYGRLSVMVQSKCEVTKLFRVGSGAFSPPPRVDSAVVRLTPHAEPPAHIKNHSAFALIVREGFNQRRKTLRNALRHLLSDAQIESVAIDPGLRPEQLTISQFAALANLYHKLENQ